MHDMPRSGCDLNNFNAEQNTELANAIRLMITPSLDSTLFNLNRREFGVQDRYVGRR